MAALRPFHGANADVPDGASVACALLKANRKTSETKLLASTRSSQ